jgi:hypothetical protein
MDQLSTTKDVALPSPKPVSGKKIGYLLQRIYVRVMMWLICRLLQAASAVDPVVCREVSGLPEPFRFVMRVRSGTTGLALAKQDGQLRATSMGDPEKPDLVFEFKHVAHAFLVLSFMESTPQAFANDRILVDGEFANAMKVLRALNRMQAVVLPKFVAVRALKAYPRIGLGEKVALAVRIYLRMVIQLFGGK